MKKLIALLLAALITLLQCAESGFEYNNPWDDNGTNYNGGGWIITFDSNGWGGTVNTTPVKTGEDKKLESLPELKREGYTFNGWYTAQTGGTMVTTSTVFNSNTTIYARWTLNTYTVTFDSQNGSYVSSQKVENDKNVTKPADPTLSGYFFDGWYKEATYTTRWFFSTDVVRSDITLYAKWNEALVDTRDGKTYKKITIGTQTWMAENLDYDVEGSTCYNNSADNCSKYGHLYNWSTAMNGASSSSANPSGVQGVCPVGWHLPSNAEWDTLITFAGGSSAGTALKSTTGWYYNGTDDYGFSALPGGYGTSAGGFSSVGSYGYWWSATESGANDAWYRSMEYSNENVFKYDNKKADLFSVRCVQNCVGDSCNYTVTFDSQNGSYVSPQNVEIDKNVTMPADPTRSGYTFDGWYKEAAYTTKWDFDTDVVATAITLYAKWEWIGKGNDIKNYKTVVIGTQTWMAENLDYYVEGSKCSNNSNDSCAKYGRLYNWSTAMNGASSSNKVPSGVRGVCPANWHLPSDAEWYTLVNYVGDSSNAGTKLKSSSYWRRDGARVPAGTDDFGFSALPGGSGSGADGSNSFWWSATEYYADKAFSRYMWYLSEDVKRFDSGKTNLFSVRCVADF